MAVADLIYSIAGDSSKFIRALEQADKQLQKSIQGMSAMGKVGAYVTAGLGAAATALGELSRQALTDMVEIQRSVERTGVSAEEFTKLSYAASLAGLQIEDMADATFELALKLGEAGQKEKGAIDAFAALGIEIHDASGNLRSASDVTDDFFDAIVKVPDAASRAALAAGILGDDVALKMSPMLAQGSEALAKAKAEAEKLGLVLTNEATAGALQFQQNLTRLQGVADGVGRQLVEVFTPALTVLSNTMVENAQQADNMASRQEAAVGVMRGALVVVRTLGFAFQYLAEGFARFGAGVVNEAQLVGAALTHISDKAMTMTDWTESGTQARERIEADWQAALKRRNAQQAYLEAERDRLIASWEKDVDTILNASANAQAKKDGLFVGPTLEQAGRAIRPGDLQFAEQVKKQSMSAREKLQSEIKELQRIFGLGLIDEPTFRKAKKQLEDRMKATGKAGGKALVDGLKEELAKATEDATKAGVAVGNAVVGGALKAIQERREVIGGAMAEAMARVAEARKKAEEETQALLDRGAEVAKSTLTPVEAMVEEQNRLKGLFDAGAISADVYGKALANMAGDSFLTQAEQTEQELDRMNHLLSIGAITAAQYDAALGKLFPSAAGAMTEMQKFGATAASTLAESFQQLLFDPFNADLAGMVRNFASALARMATELLAKKAVLALFGGASASPAIASALTFADGGFVSGPGTATSDSIPARLSDGEYVMPAKTVSHFGVEFMDAIRAMKPSRPAPVARFAEGGYVSHQGGGGGGGVRVVNVVDSSMVQDFLTSSAGEQVILNTIRRNRRQVSQVVA